MTEPTQGQRYRRIKHAQGLQFMAEGKTEEARKCFDAVWSDAKKEAKA